MPEERAALNANAAAAGLPVSAFLLAAGLGTPIRSVVDLDQVSTLAEVHADLGRLGGLLKLWLSHEERFASGYPDRVHITDLLENIRQTQADLHEAAKRIVDSF
ncbi:conjugal transfer protein TraJ [Azospirillum formosense]